MEQPSMACPPLLASISIVRGNECTSNKRISQWRFRIHDSDIREVSLRLKAIAKISKSEDEFYEKVEKFYNDYPNFYSTLTKKDYLELAKGMYKPLTESQLFENIMKHEKAYNGKMEEYGWKVPPKEI